MKINVRPLFISSENIEAVEVEQAHKKETCKSQMVKYESICDLRDMNAELESKTNFVPKRKDELTENYQHLED